MPSAPNITIAQATLSIVGGGFSPERAQRIAQDAFAGVERALAQSAVRPDARVLATLAVPPVDVDLARMDDGTVARLTAARIWEALMRETR